MFANLEVRIDRFIRANQSINTGYDSVTNGHGRGIQVQLSHNAGGAL